MSDGWTKASPGIYSRPIPMDKRRMTIEGLEELQADLKKKGLSIPCEVYSRVVGYLRPVHDWHPAKQQEFEDRVTFKLEEAGNG